MLNKDKLDALFSSFSLTIYPLHVSNRLTDHHQQAFTVYAGYGIYRAEKNSFTPPLPYPLFPLAKRLGGSRASTGC